MADLSSRRATEELDLTDRKRREVVMQHETLERLPFEVFDLLRFLRSAERHGDESLRLAASEDRRAVRPRQNADLNVDRTDLGERASVEALAFAGDDVAKDALFHLLVRRLQCLELLQFLGRNGGNHLRLH